MTGSSATAHGAYALAAATLLPRAALARKWNGVRNLAAHLVR